MLETKESKQIFHSNSDRLRQLTHAMQKIEQLSNIYNPNVKARRRKKNGAYLTKDRYILQSTSDLNKPVPPMLRTYDKLNKLKSLKKRNTDNLVNDVQALQRGDSLLYRRQSSNLSSDGRNYSDLSKNIRDNLDKAMQPLKELRSKTKDLQGYDFPFYYGDPKSNDMDLPATTLSRTFVVNTNTKSSDTFLNLSFCQDVSQQKAFPPAATLVDMSERSPRNGILPKPTYAKLSPRGTIIKSTKPKTPPKSNSNKRSTTYVKTVHFEQPDTPSNTDKSNLVTLFDSYYSFQGDMFDFSSKYSNVSSPLRADDFMTRPNTVVFSVDETASELSEKTNSEDTKITSKRIMDKKPLKVRKFKKIEKTSIDVSLEAIGQKVSCSTYNKTNVQPQPTTQIDVEKEEVTNDDVSENDVADFMHQKNPLPLLVNKVEFNPEFPEPQRGEVTVKLAGIEKEKHINKNIKATRKSLSDAEDSNVKQVDRRRFILARTDLKPYNEKEEASEKIMFTVSQYRGSELKDGKIGHTGKLKQRKSIPGQFSLKEKTPMLVFFNHANQEAVQTMQTEQNAAKAKHYKVVSDYTHSQYLQNIGRPVLNKSLTDISDKSTRNASNFDPLSKLAAPADDSDASIAGAWRQQRKRENPLSLSEKLNRLNHYANKNKIYGMKNVMSPDSKPSTIKESIQNNQEKIRKNQDNFDVFVQTEFGLNNPLKITTGDRLIKMEKCNKRKVPYPPSKPERTENSLQTSLLNLMPEVTQKIPKDSNAVNEHPGVYYESEVPQFRRATIPPKQSNTLKSVQSFNFDPRVNLASLERMFSRSPVSNDEHKHSSPDSAAILPDSNRSSAFRLKHDVSFDEGSRYRNIQSTENFSFSQNDLKNNGNRLSPNNSRMDSRRHLCSMPSPAHVSFKETMPLSLIRMEDRLNEIPLAAASSPVTPTNVSPSVGPFTGLPTQKQGLGSSAPTNGGTITTFRLHKGKANWNCKLGELSINGGGFYGSTNIRDSTSYASINTSSTSNQIQKNSCKERNSITLKSQMSSRYGKSEDTKTKDKEAVYQDPCIGAAPSYQQRLMDLSMLESETVKYERNRRLRRKKNQDKDS